MVSVHSPCSLPGLHTSPISTWKTEQDLLRLLHHYLSANTQTCCKKIVLLSLMTYSTTLYVSVSLQKASWQHYKTPAGVAVKETINFSDEHILIQHPQVVQKMLRMRCPPPHPPCPPGAVGSERALIVSLPTLNSLHVILNTIVNLLSQNSIWTSA